MRPEIEILMLVFIIMIFKQITLDNFGPKLIGAIVLTNFANNSHQRNYRGDYNTHNDSRTNYGHNNNNRFQNNPGNYTSRFTRNNNSVRTLNSTALVEGTATNGTTLKQNTITSSLDISNKQSVQKSVYSLNLNYADFIKLNCIDTLKSATFLVDTQADISLTKI